jgi:stage IV sporulation protein FB
VFSKAAAGGLRRVRRTRSSKGHKGISSGCYVRSVVFQTGFWTLARYRGIPIRLHWSIPLGALFFGRFELVPGFWLGFVVLVLIHELGHAFLARSRRLPVYDVQVHGLGGVCVHRRGTPFDDAIVAWGGVLAQLLVLYVPAAIVVRVAPEIATSSAFVAQLFSALLWTNLWLAGINLLPIPPLDGAKAWQLPKLWWERRRKRRAGHRAPPPTRAAPPRNTSDAAHQSPPADTEDAAEVARRLAREALESARKR